MRRRLCYLFITISLGLCGYGEDILSEVEEYLLPQDFVYLKIQNEYDRSLLLAAVDEKYFYPGFSVDLSTSENRSTLLGEYNHSIIAGVKLIYSQILPGFSSVTVAADQTMNFLAEEKDAYWYSASLSSSLSIPLAGHTLKQLKSRYLMNTDKSLLKSLIANNTYDYQKEQQIVSLLETYGNYLISSQLWDNLKWQQTVLEEQLKQKELQWKGGKVSLFDLQVMENEVLDLRGDVQNYHLKKIGYQQKLKKFNIEERMPSELESFLKELDVLGPTDKNTYQTAKYKNQLAMLDQYYSMMNATPRLSFSLSASPVSTTSGREPALFEAVGEYWRGMNNVTWTITASMHQNIWDWRKEKRNLEYKALGYKSYSLEDFRIEESREEAKSNRFEIMKLNASYVEQKKVEYETELDRLEIVKSYQEAGRSNPLDVEYQAAKTEEAWIQYQNQRFKEKIYIIKPW